MSKLVRDNIVAIMEKETGITPSHYVLTDAEYTRALLNKLVEEAEEVRDSIASEDMIEELADLREVMTTLMIHVGIVFSEVEKVQNSKRKEKGAFKKRHYLIT